MKDRTGSVVVVGCDGFAAISWRNGGIIRLELTLSLKRYYEENL